MLAEIGKYFIREYWRKTPESERRVCIHKVSCSRAVYEDIEKQGFWLGVKTYLQRRKTCNNNYRISKVEDKIIIYTKYGLILNEFDINPTILKEFNTRP